MGYALNLHFYEEVDRKQWSWQLASAGRLTALVPKRLPGHWPRLLASSATVKNMASWPELSEKWAPELKSFKNLTRMLTKSKVSSFGIEPHDFKALDENGDGLASRGEFMGFAKEIVAALYKD